MMTDQNAYAREIWNAYEAGKNDAQAIKLGDIFLGAMPAAEAAGYTDRESGTYRCYLAGYLDLIATQYPRGIVCDGENKIVRFQR